MNLNLLSDDKETLLPTTNHETIHIEYEKSEPFDIEGSQYTSESRERPPRIPSFLLEQRSLYEKSKSFRIFCCCCAKRYKQNMISNIKNKELRIYYKIKSLACQLFDENIAQHKESLKFLYMMCINKDMNNDCRAVEWKKVGFQVRLSYIHVNQ
jgi:hypothetical protein